MCSSSERLRILQAFLSGGKRFASPLSGRNLISGSPRSGEERKGPSFADLLNGKSRPFHSPSRRDFREKHRFPPQEPLIVNMVRAESPPASRRRPRPSESLNTRSAGLMSDQSPSRASSLRASRSGSEPSTGLRQKSAERVPDQVGQTIRDAARKSRRGNIRPDIITMTCLEVSTCVPPMRSDAIFRSVVGLQVKERRTDAAALKLGTMSSPCYFPVSRLRR